MNETTGIPFADYRIEGPSGTDPMTAATVTARHVRMDRVDDLTILAARYSADDEFRERFLATAELAARQRHPNLAVVRDAGVQDGRLWLASQHIDGIDVGETIRLGGLDPARAVHIVGEVAKGLDELHGGGLRHGDLKPADVLVTEQPGAPDRVVLTGYGLARPTDGPAALTYPAPEQTAGAPADHRTEVYALGCLLSEMLTAVRPDPAHPVPPTQQNPWLPPEFDTVVARATAADPEQRYPDCAALARAATQAAGAAATPPARPRRRRVRLLALAAAVIVVAAAGIVGWSFPERRSAAPSPRPHPAAPLTRSPELKAALWGDYAYMADTFPNLLPVSADGVGYQELYNCRPVTEKGRTLSLYDHVAVGMVWCLGNRNPVWNVYVICNADKTPMRPQTSKVRIEGDEHWTRPTGTGYLRWGGYRAGNGDPMVSFEVFFDNPQESFCRWVIEAEGSAGTVHGVWWPGVSV
ncbi:serine/threonine-protein kinase [Nocardia seriolae]|uniref:non-specific serine/threonine protein kinase n=3 Tax=Nocardia seriolae TaxID=37332 RepID=A0ABC8B0R2_9NOCA|nr:serine/threonine-protein kinase [Nocardia seriolae]APA99832.1 Non-specific serine/threonine protein kinase [Nocardia seriolae]OJF79733.1 hypothetical protein NS14008_11670 [Nocardia seriolae]PSK28404.1 serine/threonine protein kinase [Nocardia seriolae]QOW36340.1 serine/threonine protein kinase [Nocardia seriolae]QUN16151.1 serine/threonine protein kinase [Nocardia seriolae]